jgi:ABC-2 type transport system ATP-binding protein
MSDIIVATHGLTKRYGDRIAVNDVNLTVGRGEVYGFLGPNGAGKTTTLRMVLGLVTPTAGTVDVLGHAPGDPAGLRSIGALVEGPGFYPYLSGRRNLEVLAAYRGLPGSAVADVLGRVDLTERAGDRFSSYSLGMKQRLGVAAAMLGDPEVLILDEPTNGLDPAGMADMRALIVDLAREGRTVLLSSHLLAEVQEICDRVGVIAGGRLLTESTVADLRGASSLLVRAEPLDIVLATAMEIAGDDDVHVIDPATPGVTPSVQVDGDVSLAPLLTRALVRAGADVYEIRTTERTLEDVFFELTGSPGQDHQEVAA